MKKTCVECKARFEVKLDDIEEGDAVNCTECNYEYVIVADKKGNLTLVESKVLDMENDEDSEGLDEEEDYESDD